MQSFSYLLLVVPWGHHLWVGAGAHLSFSRNGDSFGDSGCLNENRPPAEGVSGTFTHQQECLGVSDREIAPHIRLTFINICLNIPPHPFPAVHFLGTGNDANLSYPL